MYIFRYNETLEKNYVLATAIGNFRICGFKYDVQYILDVA